MEVYPMRLFANIAAAILFILGGIAIILGFLFILGAFSPQGSTGWLLTGAIIGGFGILFVAGGIVLVFYSRRKARQEAQQTNVTLNIDLPGEMKAEALKCRSCGGVLSSDDIKMVDGAPVVTCPYCGTTYQLSEEPKW
jgi:hypothetical protein